VPKPVADKIRARRRSKSAGQLRLPGKAQTVRPIKILIADDHAVVRDAITALLELEPDIEVVGAVGRADELRPALSKTPCDILLLDLKMDRWVIKDIAELTQSAKVVVLTAADRDEDIIAALRGGAHAIVHKSFAAETLREAIRSVAGGLIWMPPALRTRLTAANFAAPSSEPLTARESEIVRYVAVGLRNAEVAHRLAITEGTVKIHLNNIFGKLDVRDRVQLTLYALRTRLITLE
jgi:DNA-binding NarL/FixJ family response regulator